MSSQSDRALALAQAIGADVKALNATVAALTATPIRFSADTPTIGPTGTDEAQRSRTITTARMRCETPPTGSSLVVEVQHYNGTVWSVVTTLTILSGGNAASSVGLTQAQVVGNRVRLNVTSVGSTSPARDVVVDVITT